MRRSKCPGCGMVVASAAQAMLARPPECNVPAHACHARHTAACPHFHRTCDPAPGQLTAHAYNMGSCALFNAAHCACAAGSPGGLPGPPRWQHPAAAWCASGDHMQSTVDAARQHDSRFDAHIPFMRSGHGACVHVHLPCHVCIDAPGLAPPLRTCTACWHICACAGVERRLLPHTLEGGGRVRDLIAANATTQVLPQCVPQGPGAQPHAPLPARHRPPAPRRRAPLHRRRRHRRRPPRHPRARRRSACPYGATT